MPSLAELARVIKAGACIEASFKRGKGEVGMDEYQVRTWPGWHHHMALSLMAVWFLIGETHRGRQLTPRAGRCRGLCRYRDLFDFKIHVRIPALEDAGQFPVEHPHSRL